MDKEEFYGLAVVCDASGRISDILRNDLCEELPIDRNSSLSSIIDTNSLEKYLTFMYRLKEERALYDWSINVECDGSVVELYFVGGMYREELLIVASTSRQIADSYFTELMQMNNEQTNLIRSSMKREADRGMCSGAGEAGEDDEMYSDFSRLNNELSNLQREMQKKNRKLEKTIEERDRYIGMAAHDLRNPLSGFTGMCGLLLEEEFGELGEEQQEVVELMKENAEYMLGMVNNMLEISTVDSGTLQLNREDTDLLEVIKRSVGLNKQMARKKDIRIHLEEAEGLPALFLDRVKLTQVLDNLISNGIKFSYPGTVVTVRVRREEENRVLVEVEDQGQGIPAEDMTKLFEPFTKVNVKPTGGERSTGLGLLISRRIVEGHGGVISAESRVGEGSTFRFSLPVE